MVNNSIAGTPDTDYPCHCIIDNTASASATMAEKLGYSDLFTCSKCNYRFYSNVKSIECPNCSSRLVQGSQTRDKNKELKRVINAKFEVDSRLPPGPILDRPIKRKY